MPKRQQLLLLSLKLIKAGEFNATVIRQCIPRLRELLPVIKNLVNLDHFRQSNIGSNVNTLKSTLEERDYRPSDANVLESLDEFVVLGNLLLTGFGPAALDERTQQVERLIIAVERHIVVARRLRLTKN